MNLKNKISPLLLSALLLGACAREVSIVEFNDSYKIDEKYISVDIPEKLNHNPNNIIFYAGAVEMILTAQYDITANTVTFPNKRIPIKVKLKKPLPEAMNVVFTEDKDLLQSYTGEQLGYKTFPEGTFADAKIAIPKGQIEATGEIELKNTDNLGEVPGYLAGLKLTLEKETDNVVVSKNNYTVYVKVNTSIVRDNIDSANIPFEGTAFNKGIAFESSKENEDLRSLNDGDIKKSWFSRNADEYLTIKLPKEEMVKGFKINTIDSYGSYYQFASAKISAEEKGLGMVVQGTFSTTEEKSEIYIRFKTPVSSKYFKFENLRSLKGGSAMSITEINLIK